MKFAQPTAGGANRGDDAVQRASLALNNQRPQEAEGIAREVLRADPRHAQALHILGYALLMQGRADDAVAALEPAARGQNNPQTDTQLALALRQAGRDEDALARLRRAIRPRPPYLPAFYELGRMLFSLKRFEEAVAVLRRALDIAPMMPDLSMQLGHVLLAQRNCAAAKGAFARALEISPGSAGALWGMGKAHQMLGESRAATEYFRRCLMQTPNDVGTLLNLGNSLVEAGELDAGFECFRAAARGGDDKRYAGALTTLVKSARGRFWLKPSDAARFLQSQTH
jgi:tetratricopeptide (TPR) repeat protein